MPKGDRLKLKADPEDGTTPISNLLLEAVAMARISGLQKGAIIYLIRCTYGWVGKDGKREKEAKITLGDWVKALDKNKSRISKALGELCDMNILTRRVADVWGGYYYKLNTDISKWNSNSINLSKLAEVVTVAHLPTVSENATVDINNNSSHKQQQLVKTTTVDNNKDATVGENDNATVGENDNTLPIYKEILNKDINKKADVLLTSSFGKQIGEVFVRLDKLRGYKTTKRKAEAVAIMRMLKSDSHYTPDQIISTWETLKAQPFWQKKELFMTTIESQIGAILDGTHIGNNKTARNSETDNQQNKGASKFTGGKFGEFVQH